MTDLAVHLAPSLVPMADGSWRPTYHSSRSEALELMFGEAIRDVLVGWSKLQHLHLHVQDNDKKHGPEWWCSAIRERLREVASVVAVQVDHCRWILHLSNTLLTSRLNSDEPSILRGTYNYSTLWKGEN